VHEILRSPWLGGERRRRKPNPLKDSSGPHDRTVGRDNGSVHRPYADASDLARIHDLLQRIYAVSGPRVRMTPGDLEYWRFQAPDPDAALAGSELWFDGDELVGFAWPDERSLDFAVHPEHEHLLPDVLDWGARGNIPVRDDDTVLQDLLRARGYVPEREGMHWYRVRDLDEPVAPAGREVRSAPDPAAIAKLHTARPISERAYRALPDSPFYRADLDLYVADPEGAPVAFTIGTDFRPAKNRDLDTALHVDAW